jgi:hypothetical protein
MSRGRTVRTPIGPNAGGVLGACALRRRMDRSEVGEDRTEGLECVRLRREDRVQQAREIEILERASATSARENVHAQQGVRPARNSPRTASPTR